MVNFENNIFCNRIPTKHLIIFQKIEFCIDLHNIINSHDEWFIIPTINNIYFGQYFDFSMCWQGEDFIESHIFLKNSRTSNQRFRIAVCYCSTSLWWWDCPWEVINKCLSCIFLKNFCIHNLTSRSIIGAGSTSW